MYLIPYSIHMPSIFQEHPSLWLNQFKHSKHVKTILSPQAAHSQKITPSNSSPTVQSTVPFLARWNWKNFCNPSAVAIGSCKASKISFQASWCWKSPRFSVGFHLQKFSEHLGFQVQKSTKSCSFHLQKWWVAIDIHGIEASNNVGFKQQKHGFSSTSMWKNMADSW